MKKEKESSWKHANVSETERRDLDSRIHVVQVPFVLLVQPAKRSENQCPFYSHSSKQQVLKKTSTDNGIIHIVVTLEMSRRWLRSGRTCPSRTQSIHPPAAAVITLPLQLQFGLHFSRRRHYYLDQFVLLSYDLEVVRLWEHERDGKQKVIGIASNWSEKRARKAAEANREAVCWLVLSHLQAQIGSWCL